MLVHKVTDDAVLASAGPVDGPIQLAVATAAEAVVLQEKDLQPVRDTASAFRMHQADFLKRTEGPAEDEGSAASCPTRASCRAQPSRS
ncbi:MAG: hypothetical protein ACOYD4_04955 [Solirubrobacterales bacterium]